MSKILVLGAKGNLGPAIVEAFTEADTEVIAWDREQLDVTDAEQVMSKIAEVHPEIVVNCAAFTAVDKAEEAFELATKLNGDAVGYIARACQKIGAIMVHFTSEMVFPGTDPDGYKETDTPDAVNAYGKSKIIGEEQLRAYHDKYYLVRSEWLYAKPDRESSKKSFNDIMLELAGSQPVLKGVIDEIGKPTYVKDLAQAVKKLIDNKKPFGIYHLVNEGVASRLDWTKEILAINNLSNPVEPVSGADFPRPAKRPHYGILINTKAEPLRSWQDALRDYFNS